MNYRIHVPERLMNDPRVLQRAAEVCRVSLP